MFGVFWVVALHALLCFCYGFEWPWEDSSSSSSSGKASATSSASSSASGSSSGFSFFSSSSSGDDDSPYKPRNVTCPTGTLVRKAGNISDDERDYVSQRQEITNKNLIDFLDKRANISDFDAKKFVESLSKDHNITIGLAFSGGGYRAMLNGAGQILGLDKEYDQAADRGLGGLLQSSTYLTGLSGGSWLVGTLVLNDWISVADILDGKVDIWNLEDSIFNPNGLNLYKTVKYYNSMFNALSDKEDAGFPTSLTDIWGRALSYQFFTNGSGENVTWSSIRNLTSFKDYSMPFPIVVSDGRTPHTMIIDDNSTVFEFTPFELGSWDPSLGGFTDLQYIGSEVSDGKTNSSKCVVNFDNAGFVMGTSSTLFNQAILRLQKVDMNKMLKSIFTRILGILSYSQDDIAAYTPNPFAKYDHGSASVSIIQNNTLFLVDGGEDQQNVPLYPLLQTPRKVDVIFAFDNSGDTSEKWPNGTSLVHTYKRQFTKQGKGTPFPYVPSEEDFVDKKLNKGPVFFGCDASNLTDLIEFHDDRNLNETDVPLVVYIPNYHTSYKSNTSTYKMSYDDDEKRGLIQNGFEVATSKNLTDDEDWAACVGCALIRRSQERLGQKQPDDCKKCFKKYCWVGNADSAVSASSSSGSSTSSTSGSSSSSTSKGSNGGSGAGLTSNTATSSHSSSSSKSKKNGANVEHSDKLSITLALILSFVI